MRKLSLICLIFCILLFFPLQMKVSAENDPNETVEENLKKQQQGIVVEDKVEKEVESDLEISSNPVSVTAWDYVKMILALLFVIVLLYGLLRFLNSRNKSFQQNQLIQNLGGVGLGQSKSVQLLQVGDSLLLVGIGEDITLLKEITDPDEIDKLTKIYEEKHDIRKAGPYISELFGRLKENVSDKTTKNEKKDPSFNETFQERLNEIKKDRSEVLEDWKTKEHTKNE